MMQVENGTKPVRHQAGIANPPWHHDTKLGATEIMPCGLNVSLVPC